MAGLLNRVRHLVVDGRPLVLGLAAVGDALICTNPLYGRGCSLAAVHAQLLTKALREHPDDLEALALQVDAAAREEILPWYDASVAQDEASRIARAKTPATQSRRSSPRDSAAHPHRCRRQPRVLPHAQPADVAQRRPERPRAAAACARALGHPRPAPAGTRRRPYAPRDDRRSLRRRCSRLKPLTCITRDHRITSNTGERRSAPAGHPPRAHRRSATRRRQGGLVTTSAETACPECFARMLPSDRFCRRCGAESPEARLAALRRQQTAKSGTRTATESPGRSWLTAVAFAALTSSPPSPSASPS